MLVQFTYYSYTYTVTYTIYNVHCTLYNVQCTLYTVYNVLYIVQCIFYNVRCSLSKSPIYLNIFWSTIIIQYLNILPICNIINIIDYYYNNNKVNNSSVGNEYHLGNGTSTYVH